MNIDKLNEVAQLAMDTFPWLNCGMKDSDYEVAMSLLMAIIRDGSDEDFLEKFDPLISLLAFSLNAYMDKLDVQDINHRLGKTASVTAKEFEKVKSLLSKRIVH